MARYSIEEYVRWEDIDAAGIINYQAYLRFFALAEAELLRSAGLNYRFLFESLGIWLPRAHPLVAAGTALLLVFVLARRPMTSDVHDRRTKSLGKGRRAREQRGHRAGEARRRGQVLGGGMSITLRVAHLYPRLMNIYGDRGNVIALGQRAKWRGIASSRPPTRRRAWKSASCRTTTT